MFKPMSDEKRQASNSLAAALSELEPGGVLTNDIIRDTAGGFDVLGRDRRILNRARKIAERERSVVFKAAPNVGIRRATEMEILMDRFRSVGRLSQRDSRRATRAVSAGHNHTTETERRMVLASTSRLRAIALLTRDRAKQRVDKLMAAAPNAVSAIPPRNVLRIFLGKDTETA